MRREILDRRSGAALLTAIVLAGCATPAHDIAPAYVSPLQLTALSCDQIKGELERVGRRAAEIGNLLDEKARSDQAVVALGFLFFTPIMLAVQGNGPEAVELARLKGERVALVQAAIGKECEEYRVNAQAAFRVGDQLEYVDYDPIAVVVTGQQTLVVTDTSDGKVVLNNGESVLSADGSWKSTKGGIEFDALFRFGAVVGERWSTTFTDRAQQTRAKVAVQLVAVEAYTTEKAAIPAHRLRIDGWASGPLRNAFAGAVHGETPVRGEIVVDARHGMPLSLSLESKGALSVKRALIRRVQAGSAG